MIGNGILAEENNHLAKIAIRMNWRIDAILFDKYEGGVTSSPHAVPLAWQRDTVRVDMVVNNGIIKVGIERISSIY